MNEEEKKAIEMLDKFITEHKLYNIKQSDGLEDNIKIVLYLIEKLQKENEELKKEIKSWKKYSDEQEENIIEKNNIICNLEFQREKQQKEIKDKIEELDERIKNPEKNSYWASYKISECIGIRSILQELLKRGKNE